MYTERKTNIAMADRVLTLAGLEKGSRILDVGCGEGEVMAYLAEERGMVPEGIDINLSLINDTKKTHPGLNVKYGDGEFLDGYMSFTFDGVLMQRTLRYINLPDEALHEAYCVLKKGGTLMIADAYHSNPDPKQLRAMRIETRRKASIPRKRGDCENIQERFVDFRLDGVFFEKPLRKQLEEIGYEILAFEPFETEKDDYIESCAEAIRSSADKDDIRYFMLVARKPL